MKERRRSTRNKNHLFLAGAIILILGAATLLWAASLRIPDLSDLETSISAVQSTKIYDRTGQVLLYDMSQNVRRTIVPFDQINDNMKHAVVSIEDKDFYTHGGIDFKGIARALLDDIKTLSFSQGGSTITQQVVKNTILTADKTPTRKLKEAILAEKLEKSLNKDQILNIYLNGIPLGGQLYGVEEAAKSYYGVDAKDLSVAQSAYLAAMIQAPTYYSPYGNNKDALELRKNLVLKNMHDQGYIDDATYQSALTQTVTFLPRTDSGGIKAPHFVFFVISYLEQKYGEDALEHGGLKVTTTLDWQMQQDTEGVVTKYGATNQKNFNASNEAAVVVDPKTGDILSMVGSRDYFDTSIDGNYNDTTANRQPGSTIKPFIYSTLFEKGFTPDSTLFDVPTQFNVRCAPNDFTSDNNCYSPQNFDSTFRGPISIRDALALSINIPAVKALYMAGIGPSIDTAHAMGITTLNDENRYGLSLVLGGGEVTLLDMTSAYGVFGNDGVRNPYRSVLKVEDSSGAVLEEGQVTPTQVIPAEIAREMSDILSDNNAKAPEYGVEGSPFYFPGREVASKTGTTNDSRDAWVIGYAPNIALGTWAGNNDNSPMIKQIAGLIVAPMWHDIMQKLLADLPNESFVPPQPVDQSLKPILRGDWQNQFSQGGVHNELYWINKDNPTGPPPSNPASDPEYSNWEYGVQNWFAGHGSAQPQTVPAATPTQTVPPTGFFNFFPTQTTQTQTTQTQTTVPPGDFGTPIYTPNQ